MPSALAEALKTDVQQLVVPLPWKSLESLRVLRGNLLVVLGRPGAGKSAFALNTTLTGGHTAVLSLDTDLRTQAVRLVAAHTGRPISQIEKSPSTWARYIEKKLTHVRMYDRMLSLKQLDELVTAETEYWGKTPGMLVVDNVKNMTKDGTYEEYQRIFMELHRIARNHGIAVMALHHINRAFADRDLPTQFAGQYGGEQEAEIVLGLGEHKGDFAVAILKNRSGEADPKGGVVVPLYWDKATMRIRDLTEQEKVERVLAQ